MDSTHAALDGIRLLLIVAISVNGQKIGFDFVCQLF